MPAFRAATAVDSLEYDFNPYADLKGTVPEPSDADVRTFYAGQGTMLEDVLGEDRIRTVLTDPDDWAKFEARDPQTMQTVMARFNTAEDMEKSQERMLQLVADVTHIDADALRPLPYRVKAAFYGMVSEWLTPEGSRPAGNN